MRDLIIQKIAELAGPHGIQDDGHLMNNVRPRGGMFLGNTNEVSVDTETGIYHIQWYDTVRGEYQG